MIAGGRRMVTASPTITSTILYTMVTITSTTVDIAAGMPSRRMYSTCMGCPPEAEGVMAL